MVKILGLCASARKSASEYVTEQALAAAREVDPSIETELVTLRGEENQPLYRLRLLQAGKDLLLHQG